MGSANNSSFEFSTLLDSMSGDKESVINGSETSTIGSDSGFSIIVSMTGGSSLGAILPKTARW